MGVYTTDLKIRFADCDPAGVFYYPRFVERLQQVIELWFENGLGIDFYELHLVKDWGIPTVELTCKFMKPTRLGEVLTFTLWLEKIGRTSFIIRQRAVCGDELRATARMVSVMRSFNQPDNLEIPPELRAGMERYLGPPGKEDS